MTGSPGTTPPLVSVVTPCFNAAPFVGETIEAVLSQTHPRVEMIVVDDLSTDGSWEVVQGYGDRITAVRAERNGGAARARNLGAERASGDFLLFLDADDLIDPDTLEHLVAAALRTPGALAACPWERLRKQRGEWTPAPPEIPLPPPDRDPLASWLEGVWVPTCSLLWPRAAYEATGGWDASLTYNDDGDLAMRALIQGAPLVRAEGGRSFYRSFGDARISLSQSLVEEHRLRSQQRVLERIATQLRERGRLDAFRDSLGLAYQSASLLGFQNGHSALARELLARGEELAGPRPVSRTAVGRLLVRALGVERKERLVDALARMGVATGARRRQLRVRDLDAARGGGGSER